MSSINCLNCKFCSLKLCIKYKLREHIVNNIRLTQNFDMSIKSIKNMQFNGYTFKICSNINDIK